jgi:3-phosphoshikimate 1-carboxyvinyltransferase
MKLEISRSAARGVVRAPPSKSYTHRAIILAGLARGESVIKRPLLSGDTLATLHGMEAFGAMTRREGDDLVVRGGTLRPPSGEIDCGNSGTTLRLLAGVASLLPSTVTLTGDASLQQRPMKPLLAALGELGVSAASARKDGTAPLIIRGPNKGRWAHIKGDVSSQFISSLLISSALKDLDTEIVITTPLLSKPYIDITMDIMARFGVRSWETKDGYHVPGGQTYRPLTMAVPGDYSSAAYPLAAGALTGKVTVSGLDPEDRQGDRRAVDILAGLGAKITRKGDRVTAEAAPLVGCDIDLRDNPDLFPILAVLATQAEGVSRLHGAGHLRHKESDRIRATVTFLKAMGADIEERDDGCEVRGPTPLRGRSVDTFGDHRIMMAEAVAALVADGTTVISESESAAISYPSFVKDLRALGASIGGKG